MTVFYCEGFETYGTAGESSANIRTRLSATDKLVNSTGFMPNDVSLISDAQAEGLALRFGNVKTSVRDSLIFEFPDGTGRHPNYKVTASASVPVFVLGFRMYVPASITPAMNVSIWAFMINSSSFQSALRVDSNLADLTFLPISGASTTVVGCLTAGAWQYIELECKPTNTVNGGYLKIYVNGSEVADITSQTVISQAFLSVWGQKLEMFASNNQTEGENFAFDDIYMMVIDGVDHTAPLGPSRVVLLSPTAEATPNDWTPSTGTDNTALIDEQDWDTADYVDATATGNDDHYDLTTLSSATAVHGLSINAVCIAVDGTPTLHLGTHDGATSDEESMGVIGTGSTVQKRMFFEIDPAGGAWSVADVNSVEATQRMTE